LSGVGNYILAEGLYRASIDPFASLSEISEAQHRALFHQLQAVALESYAAQGMTRRSGGVYAAPNGTKGQFEVQLQCYGRQVCARGNPVIQETAGPHGRTIWYTEEQLFKPVEERLSPSHSAAGPASRTRKAPEDNNVAFGKDGGWGKLLAANSDLNSANVEVLLSSLSQLCWKGILAEEMKQMDNYKPLYDFLAQEIRDKQPIYPPHKDLFSALNLCPLDEVKVVIVGQDPYFKEGQAHGLAFSVRKGVTPPPSLKNILKEAMDDVAIDPPAHGNLEHWARQGVLLLNTVLTVRGGTANSHAQRGWEQLTSFIIQHLSTQKEGLIFLLFGNPAHLKASCVDDTRHSLIRTSHPSPLGARKTVSPFLGSGCFSRCNRILMDQDSDPIDWNLR
jgi:uracil-DNA glycosylase